MILTPVYESLSKRNDEIRNLALGSYAFFLAAFLFMATVPVANDEELAKYE